MPPLRLFAPAAALALSTLGFVPSASAASVPAGAPQCGGLAPTQVVDSAEGGNHGSAQANVIDVLQPGATVYAGKGNDVICVFADGVTVQGGEGSDVIFVYGSHDTVYAGPGGGAIADYGTGGDNLLVGGDGSDSIDAFLHADTLIGGAGADSFINTENATVLDFNAADGDVIFN